jgi:hypothetical protein
MANNIKIYPPGWSATPLYASTLTGSVNVEGVHFDGLYFWVTDDNGAGTYSVRQYYIPTSGTPSLVYSFNFGALVGLTALQTFVGIEAITGDGKDLYVGYRLEECDTDIPPTCVQISYIAKVSKNGVILKQGMFSTGTNVAKFYRDLTWQGEKILAATDGTAIRWLDPSTDTVVRSVTINAVAGGIAFDGKDLYAIRESNGNAVKRSIDGTILTPLTALAIRPKGMDYATGADRMGSSSHIADWFDGEWLAVVH